jgi:hypothetical protein
VEKQRHRKDMCAAVPAVNERELGWAFQSTNDFFEHAKAVRLDRVPRAEDAMTGLFLGNTELAYVLTGPIFCDHEMPTRDQQDLAVRLVARTTDATAVVTFGGLWVAHRCTACGCGRGRHESSCELCGAPAVPVSHNRYRHWLQYCHLQVRGAEENKWSWTSRALHDRHYGVLAWDDDCWGKSWDPMPENRWSSPWYVKPWMRPHVTVNYPVVRKLLGRPAELGSVATARRVETRVSTRLSLLRIDPVRLKRALKAVDVCTFHKKERGSRTRGVIR